MEDATNDLLSSIDGTKGSSGNGSGERAVVAAVTFASAPVPYCLPMLREYVPDVGGGFGGGAGGVSVV
jgi:hypothetical protein